MLKLIKEEVDKMVEHRDQCQATSEFSTFKSEELMPIIMKEDIMVLQEMPIDKPVIVCLSIIEQLQECLQTLGFAKAITQQSTEIATPVA